MQVPFGNFIISSQISFAVGCMTYHQAKILYHLQKVLWAPLLLISIAAIEMLGWLRMQNKIFITLKILILGVKYQVIGLMKQIWLKTGKTPTKCH